MSNSSRLAPSLRGERMPVDEIPVVDFAPSRSAGQAERKGVGLELGNAFRNVGFAYLAGHGVSQELIDRTFAEAARFFALPLDKKAEVSVDRSTCDRGWFDFGTEVLDPDNQEEGDLKEGYRIGNDLPADHPLVRQGIPFHGPNQWPADVPRFRETLEEYFAAVHHLAGQVTRAVALAIELPEDYFDAWFTTAMLVMSPLHYPPQEAAPSGARVGAGAHSDYGCLALLAQDDKGGLQVRNTAGRWIDAKPIPGTFVVNVGDMLARWTNDLFPATLHRVINTSGLDRQSIPFFYDPNYDAPVEALETCLAEGEQPRYEPTTSLAHLQERFGATMPRLDPALLEPRRE
jgi:isopenicillin N synthase-like dioxygenase